MREGIMNGIIKRTFIGREDHGILTANITIECQAIYIVSSKQWSIFLGAVGRTCQARWCGFSSSRALEW